MPTVGTLRAEYVLLTASDSKQTLRDQTRNRTDNFGVLPKVVMSMKMVYQTQKPGMNSQV